MRRAKLALIMAAAAVLSALGARHTEAQAQDSVSTVYLWKDVNGKCPATCDRNQYDCPCKTTALEEVVE